MLIDNAHKQSAGIFASVAAIGMLLFGASSLFTELQDSLNTIWDAPVRKNSNALKGMLWQRLTSFGMVVGVGVLLLASLVASAALAIVEKFFGGMVPFSAVLFEVLNIAVTSVMVALLFALIFKFVPDVRIDWEDVGIGAIVTSALFLIGKTLLALYLTTAGVGSTYGAAGSVLPWWSGSTTRHRFSCLGPCSRVSMPPRLAPGAGEVALKQNKSVPWAHRRRLNP
jgi:membrane protein